MIYSLAYLPLIYIYKYTPKRITPLRRCFSAVQDPNFDPWWPAAQGHPINSWRSAASNSNLESWPPAAHGAQSNTPLPPTFRPPVSSRASPSDRPFEGIRCSTSFFPSSFSLRFFFSVGNDADLPMQLFPVLIMDDGGVCRAQPYTRLLCEFETRRILGSGSFQFEYQEDLRATVNRQGLEKRWSSLQGGSRAQKRSLWQQQIRFCCPEGLPPHFMPLLAALSKHPGRILWRIRRLGCNC